MNYNKNGDLKPSMVASNANKKVWWICENGHEWEASINNRNKDRGCPICANKQILVGYNDLATTNPILVKEWDYEKNYPLTPNDVTSGSDKKVWWKCAKGHKWEACVANRVIGTGCPICASKIIQKGYNDLVTTNPMLAREWNYEKNYPLTPNDVTSGSNKKVWWKCEKGHEWEASICCRNKGTNCPVCANKQILVGYNDLATTNPTLAKEWNYEKNYPLTPNDIIAGSSKKVWWICDKGHEWEATALNRNNGRGCPICVSKIIQKGYNDLVTTNPMLAREWNYEKNYPLTPNDVTSGSNKKVWWICDKGHEWEACISNRNNGNKCPICAGQQVLKGYNDLETISPNLAREWNYEKNGELKPDMVLPSSRKKVWWKCEKGHEWQSAISSRTNGYGKCLICKKEK